MNYNVKAIPQFLRQAKKLAKHYHSLKDDLRALTAQMAENPNMGADLGDGIHKIRMSVTSKGKGKRGGLRLITCVKVIHNTIYLLSIYDKSDIETLTNKEIRKLKKQFTEQSTITNQK